MAIFNHLYLLASCLVLSSCSFFQDPSCTGIAPPAYDIPWTGPNTPECIISYADDEAELERPDPAEPMSIIALVDLALRNNPKTQFSWLAARAAAYRYESSKSALYPVIDFQEQLTFSDTITKDAEAVVDQPSGGFVSGGSSSGGDQQELTASLTAFWLLLDFGGRDAAIESARQALISLDWAHNRVIQDVMFSVITAYYSFLGAQESYKAALDNLKDAETTYNSAQQQYKAGVNLLLDVLQAKSNLLNAQLQVQNQRGQVRINGGQLAFSLGFPADTLLTIIPMPDKLPLDQAKGEIEELMEIAKRARPDLKGAYADFKARWYDIQTAWSAGMPTLTASGLWQKNSNIHNPIQNNYFLSETISLNVPLFAGGLYWNNWKTAIEQFEASWAAYRDKESAILLDVWTAYYIYLTNIEGVLFGEELLKTAKEAYDLALGSYKEGVNTILDVLNAQVNLANARVLLVQSKIQWATSLAALAYTTGTLYQ